MPSDLEIHNNADMVEHDVSVVSACPLPVPFLLPDAQLSDILSRHCEDSLAELIIDTGSKGEEEEEFDTKKSDVLPGNCDDSLPELIDTGSKGEEEVKSSP